MDAGLAERLATSMDPKALSALQNRNNDPAVGRAVAAQFGSFLMQGMMQDADGSAMSVAGGTGGAAVSSMFASAMGRYAMSGDKLGLAETIYRSMAAKGGSGPAAPNATPATPAPAPASATAPPAQGGGISLTPYRLEGGHRPLGAPIGRMAQPAGAQAIGKAPAHPGVAIVHDAATASVPRQASVTPTVQAPAASPASAAPASAPAPHPSVRARWDGLNLPSRANVLLPAAEADPPATPAAAASNGTVAKTVTAAASVGRDGGDPIPYGLPWTHGQNGRETGAANQHMAAATGTNAAALADAENFAEELAPAIEHAAARLGVSPRVLLAQAALETGWGHSVVGNNIFGIKAGASWSGTTVTAGTHEMEWGRLVAHQGTFRSYPNVGQAVDDYVSLVSASDRYRTAMGAGDNVAAYAQALAAGGYATDRDYAAKLTAVANSPKMTYAVASLVDEAPGRLVLAHG
jgi:hypothetical protein